MSAALAEIDLKLAEARTTVARLEAERVRIQSSTIHPARNSSSPQRLALCASGELRGLMPRLPVWSHLVRKNLVLASGAAHVDTFLVLSGTANESAFEAAKAALNPVRAIGSIRSDCSAPLLAPLCAAKGYRGTPPRARAQFFWVEQCLDAVAAHEQARGVAYDWTLRIRPDCYYLDRMPALSSLDPLAVHHTIKYAHSLGDAPACAGALRTGGACRPAFTAVRCRSVRSARRCCRAHAPPPRFRRRQV